MIHSTNRGTASAKRAWALVGLVWCTSALSLPVTAGRASTETPPDQNWVVRSLPTSYLRLTGGIDGQLPVATTALWLVSPSGTVDAVLILRGSDGSYAGRVQWNAVCDASKPSPFTFMRNQWRNVGGNEWRDDCLTVSGPTELRRVLRNAYASVAQLMHDNGTEVAGRGYVISATVARNGTYLTAELLVPQEFKGSERALSVDLGSARIPPGIVQWGVELSTAVRGSVQSFSGKFDLPRIEVKRPEPQPVGAPN